MTIDFRRNIAILIDFDGTITKKDTNDLLVKKLFNKNIESIILKEKKLKFMEYFNLLFSEIKITEEKYLEFILNEVELNKGFYEFYINTKLYNIPLGIVSGGFINGIIPFLNKYGINDLDVYANKLNFDGDNITIDFYHNIDNCCEIGSCGNCKVLHYNNYKKDNERVIFIGDGITDRAVASKADIVFAKDSLLIYCKEKNINCIPWQDFNDINRYIFYHRK